MLGTDTAALIHLTTELGYQLGPDVRVNAVAPAVVALLTGTLRQLAGPIDVDWFVPEQVPAEVRSVGVRLKRAISPSDRRPRR